MDDSETSSKLKVNDEPFTKSDCFSQKEVTIFNNSVSKHRFQVLHQNIQCLRNKTNEIGVCLESLQCKPDVLCLSEHWLNIVEESTIRIDGYRMVSCHSRREMKHGGVCIFALEGINCEKVTLIEDISIDGQIECACIKIPSIKCICLCVYRTNLGNVNIFLEHLDQALGLLTNKFKSYRLVCCGDFNVNLLEKTHASEIFLDTLKSYNMRQLIFEPTRVSMISSSLLDNIFVNFDEYVECQVTDLALSDHYGQVLSLYEYGEKDSMNVCAVKRIFSETKLRDFCKEVESVEWSDTLDCTEVNEAYNIFENKLKNVLNNLFPIKKISSKKNKTWITDEIKNLCKQKKDLYQSLLREQITREQYKDFCKTLRKHINEAKRRSNSQIIASSTNKPKAAWAIINEQINRTSNSKENSLLNNIVKKDSNTSLAQVLDQANKYFVEACPDVRNGDVDLSKITKYSETFRFMLTNANEVYQIIRNLKNKKSVGSDEIPVSVLKTAAHVLSEPISHIINLAFVTGSYPEALKLGYVRAIYKKNEKNKIENYRPITLLSNINKIFEKVIYDRLVNYLESKQILTDKQNGFRRGKSTVRAIYQSLTQIIKSLNDKRETVALCLDLSKAFDSVDHEILSRKLGMYGIEGVSLSLIKSYLRNRKQQVVETDERGVLIKSGPVNVLRGVPQGSILGPLLYILYVNELPNIITQNVVLYADDTSLIISERTKNECKLRMSESMNELEEWFLKNNLLLNIDKTQFVNFSRSDTGEFCLDYKNKTLKSSSSVSFLGVTIDSRLDWREHTEQLCTSLAKYNYALKVLSMNVNEEAAMTAFHAFVQSKISYGIIFWGSTSHTKRVLILQKRCLRNVCGMYPRDSCRPVFVRKNVLTVVSLYILECCMFIRKNPDLFSDSFLNHSYNTRNRYDLQASTNRFKYLQNNV